MAECKDGYNYCFDPSKCATCGGHCCRGESGYIWVKPDEIKCIADHLTLSVEEFATIYLRKVGHRYSLIEKQLGENDHACIFFDETKEQCSIYDARPVQCRTFPFGNNLKTMKTR